MSMENWSNRNLSTCQLIKEFDLIEEVLADYGLWDVDKKSYDIYIKEIKRAYKKEFGKKQLLGYEEEQKLVKRAEKGDINAVNQLVLANLGLVINEARKLQNLGLPLNDLISEGNFGLFTAANKVKNRGYRFAICARLYIRSSILAAITKYGTTIHYSSATLVDYRKICKTRLRHYMEHGYIPADCEVAEILNMSESKVSDTLSYIKTEFSIDAFNHLCGDYDKSDVLLNCTIDKIDEELFRDSLYIEMDDVLQKLYPREREILKMYYGIGCKEMSLEEIALEFDLTKERVRQIKEKAIRRLKGQKSATLRDYLG